jgi:hypothetical protein
MNYMKNYLLTAILFLSVNAAFSQARMQIIHNSADAAIEIVDVWMDQTLLLDNFKFRTASAFLNPPTGVPFTIAIKGPDSQDPDNPIWSHTYTFNEGDTNIMVIEGIISTSGYDPAPPFDIAVYPNGRESALLVDKTDMLVEHGSTDAPTIDIYETSLGLGLLVDNLSYSEFSGYTEIAAKDYIFEVRDETGTITMAAYSASFQSLGFKGKAITIVASGFLNPANNSNGPSFGLWVATATASGGNLIELPEYNPTAHVQIIHNSADAALSVVDVWLDNTLLLDNFNFRTASPFIDLPSNEEFTLAIKVPDSQDPDNPIWSHTYTLDLDSTYIFVAEGIVSTSGYEPATPFDVAVYPHGREIANQFGKSDMLMHHGSTDAPVMDIYETGVGLGQLVDNLNYGEFSDYMELDPLNYILEVRDETGTIKLAAYKAQFQTLGLGDSALTIVASGFMNPGNNSNGPAFGLWMALPSGGGLIELPVYAPKARVQLIHNSADAAVALVDVWLNDSLLLDNFAFRTASPFLNVPAGQEFTLAVKEPGSQDPDNPIWSHNYTFNIDEKYILVAEGIVSTSGYVPAIPFDVTVYPQAHEVANGSGQTDMLLEHGSTDAPAIDVVEVGIGIGLIADNLAYSQFAGYFGLATVNYIFQVRDQTGITKIAAYKAPFGTMGLQGDAVTLITSGFLDPANNSNGPEFGLYMAQAAGGPLVKLAVYAPMARAQLIHNSADTAVSVVDVWLNQTLLLDNFEFRTASPFFNAPADEEFTIAVTGPDSQDPYNPIWSHNYSLTEGETYIMVAEGIVSTSGYAPAIPFDIAVYPAGRETAIQPDRTDILVQNSSTDAPALDIVEIKLGAGTIVNNLVYAEFSGYLELPTLNYIFEVRDETGVTLLGTYRAPLQTLGMEGAAITVVASGFIDPAVNSNGPAFGLWAALASGGALVELPPYVPKARLQVIHNSADTALKVVDVWVNETLLFDNFAFRTASPFMDVPAGVDIDVAVKGPDSQDPSNPIWSNTYNLTEDEKYIMVANGVAYLTGYNPPEPLNVSVYAGALEEASAGNVTDLLVYQGVTDAPVIDVVDWGTTGATLVNNMSYGGFDGYVELQTANYSLNITDETGTNVLGNFAAPLADLALEGKSLTILASGFLDPSVNNDGPAFGLLAVKADGTAWMLNNTTGIGESPVDQSTLNVYPNPAIENFNVTFILNVKERVAIEIIDVTGRTVRSVDLGTMGAGNYIETMNVDRLPSGMYLLNIRTGDTVLGRKVFIQ